MVETWFVPSTTTSKLNQHAQMCHCVYCMSKCSLTKFYDWISTSEHLIKIASSIYRVFVVFENVQPTDHELNHNDMRFCLNIIHILHLNFKMHIKKLKQICQFGEIVEIKVLVKF